MIARICHVLHHDRRGVSALEFALFAPMLMMIFGGVTDLGLSIACQSQLDQAVANGAQYAFKVGATVTASQVQSMVQAASGLSGVSATVSAPILRCVIGSPAALTTGTTGVACSDGTQPGTYLTISASYTYTQILPLLSNFVNTKLQQSATVRLL
jgi:Flp pilus assembly protein TadG